MWKLLFLLIPFVILVIHFQGQIRHKALLEELDLKGFRFKHILPFGLEILRLIKIKTTGPQGQKIASKITELFGRKKVQNYIMLFWSQKVIYVTLTIAFLFAIAMAGETDVYFIVFTIVAAGTVYIYSDYELDIQIRHRRRMIQMDLPEVLNKLALLVNAGLTVPGALRKIAADEGRTTPLYIEVRTLVAELNAGRSETLCFEDFSKRCRVTEVTQFVSTVIQNMKKGNSELVSILRLLANGSWEARKNIAKRLGEEASTKLLLPMMIIFLAVALIVATPALITIGGL